MSETSRQSSNQENQSSGEMPRLRFRDRAKKALREIPIAPTLLTLGNFFCGFLAICYVADSFHTGGNVGQKMDLLQDAAWLIFLGMFFDLFDGKIARLTHQASEFGAQMDSMADVMSFGIAPAFLGKALLNTYWPEFNSKLALLFGAFYAGCAALRLARFNVETDLDEASHATFRGLPSPAAAGCLASLTILLFYKADQESFLNFLPNFTSPELAGSFALKAILMTYIGFMLLAGGLMVSRIRYGHFGKFLFGGVRSFYYLPLILILILVLALTRELFLVIAFCGYALFGAISVLVRKLMRLGKPIPPKPLPATTPANGAEGTDDDEDEIF